MTADSTIFDFVEQAKASGVSDQSLVGIMTARGWPEKDVYEALAAHYEKMSGIKIPDREGAATAAKDAFFYLLVFSTLATWTISFGSLAFTLIDRWLVDSLFSPQFNQNYDSYSIATSLAAMLVAFPAYLLVSRTIVREGTKYPAKLNSPVRKWLTYIALVIAAGVFIGDLITALGYFLRGEITSRFLAKAFIVLMLAGGAFYYYFGGLKKSSLHLDRGRLNRNTWMAALSAVAVLMLAVFGFWSIGSPQTQRKLRADRTRVQNLYQVSQQILMQWNSNSHKLPQHLDELPDASLFDPVTRLTYDYHVKGENQYELCATFSLESADRAISPRAGTWTHPAGYHCFSLNTTQETRNPYIYNPD